MPTSTLRRRGLALVTALSCALSLTPTLAAASGQKLLMLLSAPEPESQAFMLVLANEAQAAGNPVHVLLCGTAADAALKAAPEAATKVVTPKGASVKMLLEGLLKKGGTAEVCAIYLPNRKLTPDVLIDGIKPAQPAAIAARMVDPAVKIVGQ
jgi:predicted peroxiredoxin